MILSNFSNRDKVSTSYIRNVLSNPNAYYTQEMKDLNIDGKLYSQVNIPFIYVSTHNCTHCQSLIDQGANGGVAGEDVTVINIPPHRHVKIQVIDNHDINSVIIATVSALDYSQAGPVIIIIHQYAYHGKGRTINSYVHIEWYKNDVNEKSRKVNGGYHWLLTHEGYIHNLDFHVL